MVFVTCILHVYSDCLYRYFLLAIFVLVDADRHGTSLGKIVILPFMRLDELM